MSEKRSFSLAFDEDAFDIDTIMAMIKSKNRKVRNIFNEEVEYPYKVQQQASTSQQSKVLARITEQSRIREEKRKRDEEERQLIQILKLQKQKERERQLELHREEERRQEAAEALILLSKEYIQFETEYIIDSDDEMPQIDNLPVIVIKEENNPYIQRQTRAD